MAFELPQELILKIGEGHLGFAAKVTLTNKRYRRLFQPTLDRAKERALKTIRVWKGVQRFSQQVEGVAELAKTTMRCSTTAELGDVWCAAQNEDKQEIILDVVLGFALGPSLCRFARTGMYHKLLRENYNIVGNIVSESGLLQTPLPEIRYWASVKNWFRIIAHVMPNDVSTFAHFKSWHLDGLPERTEYLNELMDPDDKESVYEAKVYLDDIFERLMTILEGLPGNVIRWILLVVSLELF